MGLTYQARNFSPTPTTRTPAVEEVTIEEEGPVVVVTPTRPEEIPRPGGITVRLPSRLGSEGRQWEVEDSDVRGQ